MKIYTRTGDKGETGLLGGKRIPKSSVRLHACGSLDELNASLGIVVSDPVLPKPLQQQLLRLERLLFVVGTSVASPEGNRQKLPRITPEDVLRIEEWIDALSKDLPELKNFILPGGSPLGALLHQARAICRRAERWIIALHEKEPVDETVIAFMNRLSDYLFVAARSANKSFGQEEIIVEHA